jgi:hypothetical protein
VEHVQTYFLGNIVVEIFALLAIVAQEGVAGPATNHHDEEDRAFPKLHWHCCS